MDRPWRRAYPRVIPTRVYLGGTFNPIHIGHARLLLECQEALRADKAFFVPSAHPPHKSAPKVSPLVRVKMVQLVSNELNEIKGKDGVFGVETCELDREGPSYTIDTVRQFHKQEPHQRHVWVIGMDSLVNLPSWKQWQDILKWANVLVVNRPEWSEPKSGPIGQWVQDNLCTLEQMGLSGNVSIIETSPLAVSSNKIREQLEGGVSPQYLLPQPVLDYITQNRLY